MSSEEVGEVYDDVFDQEYVMILSEIDNRMNTLRKHDRVRIISWIKKLNMITTNKMWKKNRNLYSFVILDMMLKNEFDNPISKFPPEGHLPVLSQTIIKTRLSNNIVKALPPAKQQFKTVDSNNNGNLNNAKNNENSKEQVNIKFNDKEDHLNNNELHQDINKNLIIKEENNSADYNNNEREEHKKITQVAEDYSNKTLNNNEPKEINNINYQQISRDEDSMKFTFMNPNDKLNYLNRLLEAKNNEIKNLIDEREMIISEIELIKNQNDVNKNKNSNNINSVEEKNDKAIAKPKHTVIKTDKNKTVGKIPNRQFFNTIAKK